MTALRPRDAGRCLAALLAIAGCAGAARLSAQWSDPAFQSSTIRQVLVLGRGAGGRGAALESGFARNLADHGLHAIAGSAGAEGAPADSAAWWARAGEIGADAVLVTRLVDARTIAANYSAVASYVAVPPGYAAGWYSYFLAAGEAVDSPGSPANAPVRLEANLYLHPGNRLVWSAVSETFEQPADDAADDADLARQIATLSLVLRPKLQRRQRDR